MRGRRNLNIIVPGPFFRSCIASAKLVPRAGDPSDPANEIALRVIIVMLEYNAFGDDYPLISRRRHHALLTAARTALDQCQARQRPLPTPTTR